MNLSKVRNLLGAKSPDPVLPLRDSRTGDPAGIDIGSKRVSKAPRATPGEESELGARSAGDGWEVVGSVGRVPGGDTWGPKGEILQVKMS